MHVNRVTENQRNKPVESLNLLFASALSSESKYHTVIAYLQQMFSTYHLFLLLVKKACSFIFHLFKHTLINIHTHSHRPGSKWWLYFMRVPTVWPEKQEPIKKRFYISNIWFSFRKNAQNSSMFLWRKKTTWVHTGCTLRATHNTQAINIQPTLAFQFLFR